MSYLDLPRLHFSGLFFTGPSTINNITQNYNPAVVLESSPNHYIPGVAGWDPTGVAQWWLEDCTVLSALGTEGAAIDSSDPVIGATVQSPSPTTPMSDGHGGFYDIAKMVDLDPDQQGRSALFGVRISISLPGGAGLQGVMTVPELRQLNGRIAGARSSWGAVGNWMGTLQQVVWTGDITSSAFLQSLRSASTNGLAVKFTVDIHQNNPASISTPGDLFCYGRVLGSIGPAFEGDLAQVVPGRCLQTVTAPHLNLLAAAASISPLAPPRERVAARMKALGNLRSSLKVAAAPAVQPWNPAFTIIRKTRSQTLLSIDIGGCTLLNASPANNPTTTDGTFEVDSGISVGFVDSASGDFVGFTNGGLSLIAPNQYQQLTSTKKNCMLVKNSGVFTFALAGDEIDKAGASPLAIQVNGTTVAQESATGYWIDVSVSAERIECGIPDQCPVQLMVRKFGEPLSGQAPPVTVAVQLFDWTDPNNPQLSPSTDVSLNIANTNENGVANITTSVNVPDLTLPSVRQPLDSQIYYITLNDSAGNTVGDGGPTLSILLWNAFTAPANPTWADVGQVFSAYARLYPGMKAILDISDQQTVIRVAPRILGRMDLPMTDPAYMPVTRDLAPTKLNMLVSWLKSETQQ